MSLIMKASKHGKRKVYIEKKAGGQKMSSEGVIEPKTPRGTYDR